MRRFDVSRYLKFYASFSCFFFVFRIFHLRVMTRIIGFCSPLQAASDHRVVTRSLSCLPMAIDTYMYIRIEHDKNHSRPSYTWLYPSTAVSRSNESCINKLSIHFARRVALEFICPLISSCTYVMICLSQAMQHHYAYATI